MYLAHFGLSRPPFEPPDRQEHLLLNGQFPHVLKKITHAIQTGAPILKLIGEAGSGKTTLGIALGDSLPSQFYTLFIDEPEMSASGLLRRIAAELGLESQQNSTRLDLVRQLAVFLKDSLHTRSIVVVVDQAHALPRETLEEIRLLSDFDVGNRKHFQMVLLGLPLLDARLAQHGLGTLKSRIACEVRLQSPGKGQVHDYLASRLVQAGYDGPEIFSPSVSQKLARMADGHYGRINRLADNALSTACDNANTKVKRSYVADLNVDGSLMKSNALAATGVVASVVTIAVMVGLPDGGPDLLNSENVPKQALFEADLEREASKLLPAADVPDRAMSVDLSASRIDEILAEYESQGGQKNGAESTVTEKRVDLVIAAIEPIEAPAVITAEVELGSVRVIGQGQFEREVLATVDWLADSSEKDVSIQLHTVYDLSDENILGMLKRFRAEPGGDQVRIHFGWFSGKPAAAFLYGRYASRNDALKATEQLPKSYGASSPWIRTVPGLRREAITDFSKRS